MEWAALWLSLQLAAATTAVLCVLGLPLAYWLARARWPGRFVLEAIIALPLVLPPTVLGFYILIAISPNGAVGATYTRLTGGTLPFSFQGLWLASVLYSTPFAVRPFVAAFAAVDRRLVEASWCLGVGRGATFWRVVVPLAWPGILTGIILSFAHTVGEFGVVRMVGGNIPATRTVSIAIFDDVEALDYAAAAHTSLVLLAFSFLVLTATYAVQRRSWLL